VPGWTRATAAAWIAIELLYYFFPNLPFGPEDWPPPINIALLLGLFGSLVLAQTYRYLRVSGPVERQQTKWVIFGLAAAIILLVWVSLIGWIFAPPPVLYKLVGITILDLSFLLIPFSIVVAILHHRLWDIDLIIKRSLVVGPLLTILTVVFELANLLLLPFIFHFIPGLKVSSSIKTVLSVVIVVALFKPLHARLDVGVNRLVDWLVVGRQQSRRLARRRT